MIEPDDLASNWAEPGDETKIRLILSHDTPCSVDESTIQPARWNVGDDLGSFVIESSIGAGVTSSVYRVREKETGRTFAMKILRTRCEDTLTASRVGFRRMQHLHHPSLVRCDRMVVVDNQLAFTMEEVVGRRLVDVINEMRSENRAGLFELATQLLHDIGGALQAIHGAGLVHRDVKPDNLMIDNQGRARLIDYGLVGSYDPESDPDAQRGYLAGTYWYMAPESITKQIYPPACDVYALGCILLELIADRSRLPSPRDGDSLGQSLGTVQSYLLADTPSELAELVCDMIDPLPQNRPLAARLVQVKRPEQSGILVATNFSNGHLHGRTAEMAIAEKWVHSVVDGRPKRLHISGDSGIGKTWFLQELQRRIRSNAWFQVFDSTCRERSDVSLRAFDAMADAIARRYSRNDRESIVLEPRHAIALRQAFPSLRCVIQEPFLATQMAEETAFHKRSELDASAQETADRIEIARSEALLAGVELVDRMCEYGPVFLIVDDIQWADADTINVLDKLLSNAKGNTGIITVGRSNADAFRMPADCYIDLKLISETDSIELLRSLLCTGDFQWSEKALERLANLGDGNAYCITQLAACVGHDGAKSWHDRLLSADVEIEDIWQSRVNQLSNDAKIAIEFLAVAGGPIRRSDLAPASNLRDRCDAALKELIDLRLVYDESPKRDAVNIIHQRIARSIVGAIKPARYRSLHNSWAIHLTNSAEDMWRAARIAGHLLKADRAESAIPYIIQAARVAEDRFAFTEAARWHHRAATLLDGAKSASHWIRAVQCFEEAGCPVEAVDACRTLLSHASLCLAEWSEVAVLQHLSENLLRAGDIDGAKDAIELITLRFDPAWNIQTSLIRQENALERFRDTELLISYATPKNQQPMNESARAQFDLRREAINACIALYLPLSVLDAGYAIELLGAIYSSLALTADAGINPRVFMDAAVIECRNPGQRRRHSVEYLNQSLDDAEVSGNTLMIAEANCAVAFRHLFSCDWASTINPSIKAVAAFRSQSPRNRFAEGVAHVPMNWSHFWMGRLRDLRENSYFMNCDADERNDECAKRFVQLGLGCATQLIDDDFERARSGKNAFGSNLGASGSPWLQVWDGISRLFLWLYEDKVARAIRYHRALVNGKRQLIIKQTQWLRVLCLQMEGAIHIRHAMGSPADREGSISIVHRVCKDLQIEKIPYAELIATYLESQLGEISGDMEQALSLYDRAANLAKMLELVPIMLAANDRMCILQGADRPSELEHFIASEGVKSPAKFARLYCALH